MSFVNFYKANCKNCYKCLRTCPVKAIRIRNEQAEIVEERCVACGQCLAVCPQNARNLQSDLSKVKYALGTGKKVIASMAPSISALFNSDEMYKVIASLRTLGFSAVEETAVGADLILNIYEEYVGKSSEDIFITSCCPSANFIVEKYYPELIRHLIPFVSPMIAHGKLLKEEYGKDAFTVFIGPCISKKIEVENTEHAAAVDAVLNFDELEEWLISCQINISSLTPSDFDRKATKSGAGFPLQGGILSGMQNVGSNDALDKIYASGIEECMEILKAVRDKSISKAYIEINACKGGCINGPAASKSSANIFLKKQRLKDYLKGRSLVRISENKINSLPFSKKFINREIQTVEPCEKEIKNILNSMGKYEDKDELNCGVCGYNTCREKAAAVFEGMAETQMCLHYMRNKAERLTNIIFENSPNIIIMVNNDLNIKEMNPAAEEAFQVQAAEVFGKPISSLMDDSDFLKVKNTKRNVINKKVTCRNYSLVLIENILYLEKENIILAIMNNIMQAEKNIKELQRVKENTLNAAQEVIDKQMRVAQEIASLLGETTAETKIILTKLKKIVAGEDGDIR